MSIHPELSGRIKRISPQLYAWTGTTQSGTLLYDPQKDGISQFSDKMVYLWQTDSYYTGHIVGTMHGTLGIIPMQDTINQTSGNS